MSQGRQRYFVSMLDVGGFYYYIYIASTHCPQLLSVFFVYEKLVAFDTECLNVRMYTQLDAHYVNQEFSRTLVAVIWKLSDCKSAVNLCARD